jgi:two-component system, OmpR family, sensor histidine kinase KdpD
MTREERAALARTAGLRDFDTPELEDVDRRRSQLWLLSLLVGLTIPAAIVVLGFESLSRTFAELIDIRTVRLVLLALLVVLFGYVAERERVLRRLSTLLVEERVLTATLVARVQELDALLEASRAMNSSLKLSNVLDVILRSACDLLSAGEGSIQLASEDEPGVLLVAAVHGGSSARVGQQQRVGEGLAGQVAGGGGGGGGCRGGGGAAPGAG